MADNRHAGSGIDDFLRDEGELGEIQALAIKEVTGWQLDPSRRQSDDQHAAVRGGRSGAKGQRRAGLTG